MNGMRVEGVEVEVLGINKDKVKKNRGVDIVEGKAVASKRKVIVERSELYGFRFHHTQKHIC